MLTTLLLRSPTLTNTCQLITRFHHARSLSSLNDLEKRLLLRLGISLAESMETIRLDHIIISRFSGTQTVSEKLLAMLETADPAVTYVPISKTLGD